MGTSNIKQHVPIFISSTYADLMPFRKAVFDTLDKLKLAVSGMELFGARPQEPLETCLKEVDTCKIFVGILGMRYGSVDDATGKSFVQCEYERALEKDDDILIYLIDETKPSIAPKFVDVGDDARKLKDFKERLQKRHTTDLFSTPEDLAGKLERDLLRLFRDRGLTVDQGVVTPSSDGEKALELIEKFDVMPKRYAGSEVNLRVQFSKRPKPVTTDECDALGLAVGECLCRNVKIISPSAIDNRQFDFAQRLYAEYSNCDPMYEAKEDEEHEIVAKLIFGKRRILERRILEGDNPFEISTMDMLGMRPPPILDLNTGQSFESYTYTRTAHVKAMKVVRFES